jgi:hypothetical protein
LPSIIRRCAVQEIWKAQAGELTSTFALTGKPVAVRFTNDPIEIESKKGWTRGTRRVPAGRGTAGCPILRGAPGGGAYRSSSRGERN